MPRGVPVEKGMKKASLLTYLQRPIMRNSDFEGSRHDKFAGNQAAVWVMELHR